jgi:hypothetical protein
MSAHSYKFLPRSLYLSLVLSCFELKDAFNYRSLCKDLLIKTNDIIDYEIVKQRRKLREFESDSFIEKEDSEDNQKLVKQLKDKINHELR